MAAARWSATAVRRILRGKKVRLPKNSPAYAGDLIGLTRLAMSRHTSPRRRRDIARATQPVFTKRNIARAIDQADRGYRTMPIIGPQHYVVVALPFLGERMPLTSDWAVNVMSDALFRIAGIGRRKVGQRQRQRDARAAENRLSEHAEVTSKAGHNHPLASVTFRIDEFFLSAAIFGPMGEVVRLVRRLSRL